MGQETAFPLRLMPRILFAAVVILWLIFTVNKLGTADGFWQQYHAKDIALLSDTVLAVPNANLRYAVTGDDTKLLIQVRSHEVLTTTGTNPAAHPRAAASSILEEDNTVTPPQIIFMKTPTQFRVSGEPSTGCPEASLEDAVIYYTADENSQRSLNNLITLVRAGWHTTDEAWRHHSASEPSAADFIIAFKEETSLTLTKGNGAMSAALACALNLAPGNTYIPGLERTQGIVTTIPAGNDLSQEIWTAMQRTSP